MFYQRHNLLAILLVSTLIFPAMAIFAEESRVPQFEKIPQGETQLSPYFSIKLSGGNWIKPLTLETFHHENGKKTLIGITHFSESASRQNAYAMSDDGKILLYFHQNLPDDGGIDKPGGLYEYRHGSGARRIHSFVSNAVYLPIELPRNIIVYAQLEKIKNSIRLDSKTYLRDTNGNEKLWQVPQPDS